MDSVKVAYMRRKGSFVLGRPRRRPDGTAIPGEKYVLVEETRTHSVVVASFTEYADMLEFLRYRKLEIISP